MINSTEDNTPLISFKKKKEFIHYESKSRGQEDTPAKVKRFQGEIQTFEKRWQNFLDEGDPYYNINLSLDTEVYHMKNCKVNYDKDEEVKEKTRQSRK